MGEVGSTPWGPAEQRICAQDISDFTRVFRFPFPSASVFSIQVKCTSHKTTRLNEGNAVAFSAFPMLCSPTAISS